MTYREYMQTHPDENLSWCRPYRSKNGRVALSMTDGNISGLIIDGKEIDLNGQWRESQQGPLWEQIAKASIEDDDLLDYETRRYTWREIALMDGLVECGCADCPFADLCDAMAEEIEEPNELDDDPGSIF